MKRILLLIVFCGLAINGFSIVPSYFGARSLSLGYASTALNYDVNGIFLNPSQLASLSYSMSGYQYQNSFMDYQDFSDKLSDALSYDLAHFETLADSDKSAVFATLKDLYSSRTGMYGFVNNMPGFVASGYGISYSLINTAVINPNESPVIDGIDIFDKAVDDVTNSDIALLGMNFLGLKYKQISISYGMPIDRSISIGATVHYIYGKVANFNRSLLDDAFDTGNNTSDYLKYGWEQADTKFKKFLVDVGATASLGRYFKAGIVMRNVSNAKISYGEAEEDTIALPQRIVAGLAFKPSPQWGFYLDMDVKKIDLLYNGKQIQPISIGIERSFFNNKLFARIGMLNDISEKKFFGKEANALYGMGVGFNMKKIVVDLAIGIDGNGAVKNLAISGFFLVK